MICKMCLQQKRLIEAHIIPEWVFRNIYPDPKNIDSQLIMIDSKNPYPRKRPIGIYDTNILCKRCDNGIGYYDNYARKIFLEKKVVDHDFLELAYLMKGVESTLKIKLFFISLLWRASISNRMEFKDIDLGCYEREFRKALLYGKDIDEVQIFIGKYDSKIIPDLNDKSIVLPIKERIDGINIYYISLPKGFRAWIKVDKRSFPYPFNKFVIEINKDEFLVLKLGDFEKSQEFKNLLHLQDKIPKI